MQVYTYLHRALLIIAYYKFPKETKAVVEITHNERHFGEYLMVFDGAKCCYILIIYGNCHSLF